MTDLLRRSLKSLGGDRIVWRIAGTVILAIIGTQAATVALLQMTRPRDMPLYSVHALQSELGQHAGGAAVADGDLLIRCRKPPSRRNSLSISRFLSGMCSSACERLCGKGGSIRFFYMLICRDREGA